MRYSSLYVLKDDTCTCTDPIPDRTYLRHLTCRRCGSWLRRTDGRDMRVRREVEGE